MIMGGSAIIKCFPSTAWEEGKGALPYLAERGGGCWRVKHRMEEKDGMLDRCGRRKKLFVCEGLRERE